MGKFRDMLAAVGTAFMKAMTLAPEGDKKTEKLKKTYEDLLAAKHNARREQALNKERIPVPSSRHTIIDSNRTRKFNRYSFNEAEIKAINKRTFERDEKFVSDKKSRELKGFKHAKAV